MRWLLNINVQINGGSYDDPIGFFQTRYSNIPSPPNPNPNYTDLQSDLDDWAQEDIPEYLGDRLWIDNYSIQIGGHGLERGIVNRRRTLSQDGFDQVINWTQNRP